MSRRQKLLATALVVLLTPLLMAPGGGKKFECVEEPLTFSGPLDQFNVPTAPGDVDTEYGAPVSMATTDMGECWTAVTDGLKLHKSLLTASLVPSQDECEALRVPGDSIPYWDVTEEKCYYCQDDTGDGWCDEPFYGQARARKVRAWFYFFFDTRAEGDPSLNGLEVCRRPTNEERELGELPAEVCRYELQDWGSLGMYDGEDMSIETPETYLFFDFTIPPYQFHPHFDYLVGENPVRGTIFDFEPHQTEGTAPDTIAGTIRGDIDSQGQEVEIGFDVWTYTPMALYLHQNLLNETDESGNPIGPHLTETLYDGKARLTVLCPACFHRNKPHRFDFHFDDLSRPGCRPPTIEDLPVEPDVDNPFICRYSLIVQYGTPDGQDVVFSAPNTQVYLIDWTQEWNRGPWYPYDPYVDYEGRKVYAGPYCVAAHNTLSPEGITIGFPGGDPGPEEPAQENCKNKKDDDGDGLVDCLDPDCSGGKFCP